MVCKISLNNIRKIRREKHVTQIKLSIETGISQAKISYLENDKDKSAKLEQIEKIADALNVCPFDLMSCNCKNMDKCTQNEIYIKCKECRKRKKILKK